jgi:GTP-binding protein
MNGIAGIEPDKLTENLQPLFQEILKLPKAQVDANHPLQMLIANVDYDDFKGKMGIGRVLNGMLNAGDSIAYGKPGEPYKTAKIAELYVFNNVGREKVETASAGESVLSVCVILDCLSPLYFSFYTTARLFPHLTQHKL